MSGEWHEWGGALASLIMVAMAIKLLDDFMDGDYDLCHGERTLAARLGRRSITYTMLLLTLAAAADVRVAVVMLLGSHAVGMLSGWRREPSRVWVRSLEALLTALLSGFVCGFTLTLWALSILAAANWLDDLVDVPADKASGQRNLVLQFGWQETLILTLAVFSLAVFLNAFYTVFALISMAVVMVASELTTRHLWKTTDQPEQW